MICNIFFIFSCSGPNDHIFVYFTDHGAPGLIGFPESVVSMMNNQSLYWFSLAVSFLSHN